MLRLILSDGRSVIRVLIFVLAFLHLFRLLSRVGVITVII
jgi:hypothetical protein